MDLLDIVAERWMRRPGTSAGIKIDRVSIEAPGPNTIESAFATIEWSEKGVIFWNETEPRDHNGVERVPLADLLSMPAPAPDGPYRPELAQAFRQGASELLMGQVDIPADALVEEGEGGAWVTVRVYVSDAERALMPGEDDEALSSEA